VQRYKVVRSNAVALIIAIRFYASKTKYNTMMKKIHTVEAYSDC
jgi:hypothetical protein